MSIFFINSLKLVLNPLKILNNMHFCNINFISLNRYILKSLFSKNYFLKIFSNIMNYTHFSHFNQMNLILTVYCQRLIAARRWSIPSRETTISVNIAYRQTCLMTHFLLKVNQTACLTWTRHRITFPRT